MTTTPVRNPNVYYFSTWETGETAGYEWKGSIYKGNTFIGWQFGETEAEVIDKQDRYVAWLERDNPNIKNHQVGVTA